MNRPIIVYASFGRDQEIKRSTRGQQGTSKESGQSSKFGQGDNKENIKRNRYNPSDYSRDKHNMKERDRRARMKVSCQMMRTLIPGVDLETDKATVMEHAVNYLLHLRQCLDNRCLCGNPSKDATQATLIRPSTETLKSTEGKTTCDEVAVTEAVEALDKNQTDQNSMGNNEDVIVIGDDADSQRR